MSSQSMFFALLTKISLAIEQVVRMSHKLGWDTKEIEEVISELNQEPERTGFA